jgi:hypothetical protein
MTTMSRRSSVLAAILVLALTATDAQATTVLLSLDPLLSTIQTQWTIYGPSIGSNPSSPQFPGSDTTSYSGQFSIDLQPGTIQLLPGANITAAVGAPGAGGVPGRYAPLDPVVSDPTGGFQDNANYGLQIPALGYQIEMHDVAIDFGSTVAGLLSTPMGLAGTNFNLVGQALGFSNGRVAYLSALGNDTSALASNLPAAIFGTAGADIGSWDGTELVIPIHSSYGFQVTADFGVIFQTIDTTGMLVAHVVPIPEPGTGLLVVTGLLGLAARRERRA